MTDAQQKALRLLGLARRARLLQIGEEPVGIACRSGKAKLLLVAKDAGDHTFRRARSFVSGSKCPYVCRTRKTSSATVWAATPARCARLPSLRLQNRFLRHWATRPTRTSSPS